MSDYLQKQISELLLKAKKDEAAAIAEWVRTKLVIDEYSTALLPGEARIAWLIANRCYQSGKAPEGEFSQAKAQVKQLRSLLEECVDYLKPLAEQDCYLDEKDPEGDNRRLTPVGQLWYSKHYHHLTMQDVREARMLLNRINKLKEVEPCD